MSVISDTINLLVNINGNQAQNNLNDLRKKAADLTYEMKNNLKKGTQEYIAAAGDLRKVNADMTALKQSIGITALSMKDLNAERKKLTTLVNSSTPLSKEFKDYNAQLQKVIARQNELRAQTTGTTSVISRQASEAAKSIGLLAKAYLGFSFLKQVVSDVGKFQDQLADLRRATGLTATEAQNLNQALLSIDTRTSAEGLRNIAIIAGKLGVVKDDLLGFTQAVDKLVVSLGDELGNADEITTQLGKILNVFDGRINGDNISHLGNAIIELANAGVATGGFLVDFTQRVSGIAKASNLSLGATLGLAAGFEALGLRSESSSGALQQILTKIASDIPKAAKIAGVSVKQFNELFADKPQEALIQYAEGLAKNKATFAAVTSSFKDAEEKGIRVGQTLLAIAGNSELLRNNVDLGTKSITRLSAQEEAFALKNDTVAGSLEKLKKEWDKLIDSPGVSNFLKAVTDELTALVKAMHKMEDAGFVKTFNRVTEGFATLINDGPKALIELNKQRKAADDFIEKFHEDQQKQGQIVAPGTPGALTFVLPKDTAPGPKAPTTSNTNSTDTKSSTNSEYERLKKEAEDFYKQIEKLKEDALNASKSDDEKELIALEEKYKALHEKAIEFYQKNIIDRKKYSDEEKAIVEAFNIELGNLHKKQFEANSANEYTQALKASDDYFAAQKRDTERQYAEGKISKEDYENALTKIEGLAINNRLQIAKDYSSTVKKAAEDVKTFTIAQEDEITKNLEHQKELREGIAQAEVDAAKAIRDLIIKDPSTSPKKAADLQKQNAADKRDSALADLKQRLKAAGLAYDDATVNATQEGKAIWMQYYQDIDNIDNDLLKKRLERFDQYKEEFLGVANNLVNLLDNLDQRQLQKDKKANDQKLKNYKYQLDHKLISQKQYDAKVQKAQDEMDKKKAEMDLKAFKRQKAIALVGALINGAEAITATLAARPGVTDIATFGILRALQIGLVIAATATQVAAIAAQAPPTAAKGNWFRKGKKHSEGGINVEIEKDEAVMQAKTMTDKKKYTVTGTPAQITSKLNAMHGGVNWETGAVIHMPRFRERGPQISSRMPQIMAHSYPGINGQSVSSSEAMFHFKRIADSNEQIISEIRNQKSRLHAVVSLSEMRNEERKYEAAKRASGLG